MVNPGAVGVPRLTTPPAATLDRRGRPTYGYRLAPFGERAIVSYDDGTSWDTDLVLRDDGPDTDLGYPSSVELSDGAIFTVYYQKRAPGELCSLLWTRWELP